MWKSMVAGTAALAIAGTSLAYAQQRAGRDDMMQGRQLNAEDLRAFGEARLAALKAGLVLTPEQEKNWPAFEQAARDLAKARMERISALRNAPANNDPVERLRQRATALSETGAALKKPTPRILCTRALMRIRNGALRCSIAWPDSAALGCVDAKDAAATGCIAGASADSTGACWRWNTLADNACSHQARNLRRLSHGP
jgi:hypothetical protein